jgi:peptidoglycan/xylan/chitin deacetylase (PgdA/CDA1 family)
MSLPTHGRYGFSPIVDRPNFRWPNGAGLAVYFALGVEEYAFGQGMTEDLLPGVPQPDMANTSWRDYGNRVGAWEILRRFEALGLPLSILLNTAIYDQAPQLADAFRRMKCEIVAHGQVNSDTLAGMDEATEAAYLRAVATRIVTEEGKPPRGWSSPWLTQTPATLDLLAEQGFGYVMDLGLDDQPIWLAVRNGQILAMPYALELNDSSSIIGRRVSATEFATMIIDQFDEMLESTERQPRVMSVVIHSFISGQPFRLRALRRALDHIAAHAKSIWITQPGEIAAYIEAHPDLAVGARHG